MRAFSELLDRLVLTPSRNGKLTLMADYFSATSDPDRGYALAALTGGLDIVGIKPAVIRGLAMERIDEVLFGYSYDYVGDLAETVSLIWPDDASADDMQEPTLGEVVETLQATSRSAAPAKFVAFMDALDTSGRYALIKLMTGGMRMGVSARLAKQALANMGSVDVTEIEELWHGLEPPYLELFAWLEGREAKPVSAAAALYRPVMLANPLETGDYDRVTAEDYRAEWKWDGIRVQVSSEGGVQRLYTRTGDDISGTFPDLLGAIDFEAVLDGELLVGVPGQHVGTFSDLQQRLNRKTVPDKLMKQYPAFVRLYDLLMLDGKDTRSLPFDERRKLLEAFVDGLDQTRFDLSPQVTYADVSDLDRQRLAPPHPVIEGVMLKHKDSAYVAGRPKGPWFKWKRDPYTVDAVLMYAQRGHGKRSSLYSDFTFGVWDEGEDGLQLVPVGKAYFGFTDEELRQIDKYVRDNTIDRFGPVRSVRANRETGLVLEIAFEGLNRSSRHKSGVAMRFPRISRLRWDKPSAEADTLDSLKALLSDA
ncbi:cisplatin damage response ATP-dependent DNA ligase [Ciceribacter sp. L1K23]|uniref:cisplatin damage response ATP-dependent DNA ligase n=1 Tax=Ciceribacter sp. L1K23 TaxID=2820276 RepID=UPI001B82DF13|nr:cisplatin damage response ATP-dependent DNA ligase [Ciceribacter sp. L1K23]MBR0557965.1 cisplatin damage response ATP-dependent DNA ligase [Ciceribacter sp. L1K23]